MWQQCANTRSTSCTPFEDLLAAIMISLENAVMRMLIYVLVVVVLIGPAHAQANDAVIAPLMEKVLPDWPGHNATMLHIKYPPGGATAPHRHIGMHTFVYVLSGSVEMGVAGSDSVTLGAGETFYELPEDIHTVSKNASDELPAEFLVFILHPDGVPLVTPHEHSDAAH